jgi:hypothetical protein
MHTTNTTWTASAAKFRVSRFYLCAGVRCLRWLYQTANKAKQQWDSN